MSADLVAVRAKIAAAGDAGLTLAKLRPGGKSGAEGKAREAELREALAALTAEGAIRGPFKNGASQFYFSAGFGPSVDKVCGLVERLVHDAGVKLPSKKALEDRVKGLNKRYFADALKEALSRRTVLEVACGASRFYVHRDVAAERFGFEAQDRAGALSFEDLASVYRRLRAEQGGFTAVRIYDVIQALEAPAARVHELIAREARAGRVTVHPTTSVNLPREVLEAALRLPGHKEPFVTVAVREER